MQYQLFLSHLLLGCPWHHACSLNLKCVWVWRRFEGSAEVCNPACSNYTPQDGLCCTLVSSSGSQELKRQSRNTMRKNKGTSGAVRADKMSSFEIILKGKRKIITPHTVPLDIWFTAKWMKFWIFSVLHGSCGNCSVCFHLVVMYHPPPLHKQSCLMLMSIGAVCGLVSGIKAEEGLITSFREPWLRGQS